jgi:hypothetical protein
MARHLFLPLLSLLLISFIRLVSSAATNRILVSHEDFNFNPVFNASLYPSISEWFAAQDRVLENANNATKKCLSHFTVDEDNSVCYGDDKWEWNAVAIICVTAVVAGLFVLLWLCCDWAQTCMLWRLDNTGADCQSCSKQEMSRAEQVGKVNHVNGKKSHRRIDSVLSQYTGDEVQPKAKDVGQRIACVQSQSTVDELLSLPVSAGDGFGSDAPTFQESESTLRDLGWLP